MTHACRRVRIACGVCWPTSRSSCAWARRVRLQLLLLGKRGTHPLRPAPKPAECDAVQPRTALSHTHLPQTARNQPCFPSSDPLARVTYTRVLSWMRLRANTALPGAAPGEASFACFLLKHETTRRQDHVLSTSGRRARRNILLVVLWASGCLAVLCHYLPQAHTRAHKLFLSVCLFVRP